MKGLGSLSIATRTMMLLVVIIHLKGSLTTCTGCTLYDGTGTYKGSLYTCTLY